MAARRYAEAKQQEADMLRLICAAALLCAGAAQATSIAEVEITNLAPQRLYTLDPDGTIGSSINIDPAAHVVTKGQVLGIEFDYMVTLSIDGLPSLGCWGTSGPDFTPCYTPSFGGTANASNGFSALFALSPEIVLPAATPQFFEYAGAAIGNYPICCLRPTPPGAYLTAGPMFEISGSEPQRRTYSGHLAMYRGLATNSPLDVYDVQGLFPGIQTFTVSSVLIKAAVPEPATYIMLLAGVALLGLARRMARSRV